MYKLDQIIDNRLVQNIVTWLLLFVLFLLIFRTENLFRDSTFILLFILPFVYINNLLVLPLFYKGKVVQGIVTLLTNLTIYTILAILLLTNFFESFQLRMLYNILGSGILIFTFASALKIARDSFERRQKSKEAELKLLKGQLNPHFLFNTLNNLYGLSVVKSDKLPALMVKLSGLLRYSLYETKDTFVPLEKEVEYLENYISLERIRLEDKAKINFEKNISTSHKIAPMLLIVFVENAFKHLGISEDLVEEVLVQVISDENNILFTCTNSMSSDNNFLESENSGIGLDNAIKRLKLLYPNKYDLKVQNKSTNFSVELKLNTL